MTFKLKCHTIGVFGGETPQLSQKYFRFPEKHVPLVVQKLLYVRGYRFGAPRLTYPRIIFHNVTREWSVLKCSLFNMH